jgi:hypothetical protein
MTEARRVRPAGFSVVLTIGADCADEPLGGQRAPDGVRLALDDACSGQPHRRGDPQDIQSGDPLGAVHG